MNCGIVHNYQRLQQANKDDTNLYVQLVQWDENTWLCEMWNDVPDSCPIYRACFSEGNLALGWTSFIRLSVANFNYDLNNEEDTAELFVRQSLLYRLLSVFSSLASNTSLWCCRASCSTIEWILIFLLVEYWNKSFVIVFRDTSICPAGVWGHLQVSALGYSQLMYVTDIREHYGVDHIWTPTLWLW